MREVPPVAAVELGTSTIRVLVGELRDEQMMVTGLGEEPSAGVRKGEIIDVEAAKAALQRALQRAEENGQVEINEVHLLMSGGHIRTLVNRGTVPISDPSHQVLQEDVEHALEHAREVGLGEDRHILHTISQHFYVDGQGGVADPVGLEGRSLSVDMLVIHCNVHRLRSLVRMISDIGIDVRDVVFAGLCSALAVLYPEEKEAGVLVLDLGAGKTDFVAYAQGVIATAGCLAVGGDHVTNDIARGLHLTPHEAQQLKEQEGSARLDPTARSRRIVVDESSVKAPRSVRLSDLQTIINARMDEVFGLIRSHLERRQILPFLASGVVLTGGGARMRDIAGLAEDVLRLPCRVGCAVGLSGLTVVGENPQYAAPAGMIKYAFKTRTPPRETRFNLKTILREMLGS